MTKKRAAALHPLRRELCVGLQLVVTLSVLLYLLAVIRIHFQPVELSDSVSPSALTAIRDRYDMPFNGTAKIAFLFLARSDLPLDFLWNAFFANAAEANFSIYIHTRPGFEFDETTTRSEFFYGRQINNSIAVGWGEASMIQAERLLLAAALEDPANQRFVLLSESCVPLYNFSYIYNYLMSSPQSFVDSFLDKKEGRYNPKMSPTIPKEKWRKGSQWIALVRKHAAVVVADDAIYPVFRNYCRRRAGLGRGEQEKQTSKSGGKEEHNCIPDEHYVQTLLSISELEDELERRTLTYTLWNQSKNVMEKRGWHPMTFQYANASPQQMMEIKNIDHVYYETEYRTEWCQSNNTSVRCFLFARKFSHGAAMRLLNEGFVGPFDAAALLLTS